MKIHILFEFKDGPWGGGNQFLKALRSVLEGENLYTHNIKTADVVMMSNFPSGSTELFFKALRAKKRGAKIIYRLDGLFHKNRIDDNYKGIDDVCAFFVNTFCDGVIYQTEWVKECQQNFGIDANLPCITALNAPDASMFRKPETLPAVDNKLNVISACWAPNKRKGFEAYQWMDEHLDFTKYNVTFIGRTDGTVFKNIKHIQPLASKELAEELRKHHVFISAAFDEPCSNSLIEAMTVGLIPIGHNSGGTPEIIGEKGEVFINPEDIPAVLSKIEMSLTDYQNKPCALPSIEKIAQEYAQFMIHCPKRPLVDLASNQKELLHMLSKHRLHTPLFIKKIKNILRPIKYLFCTRH